MLRQAHKKCGDAARSKTRNHINKRRNVSWQLRRMRCSLQIRVANWGRGKGDRTRLDTLTETRAIRIYQTSWPRSQLQKDCPC
eukprot:scaffold38294_cov59-Phaeocystis_antarctica.AAC.1